MTGGFVTMTGLAAVLFFALVYVHVYIGGFHGFFKGRRLAPLLEAVTYAGIKGNRTCGIILFYSPGKALQTFFYFL